MDSMIAPGLFGDAKTEIAPSTDGDEFMPLRSMTSAPVFSTAAWYLDNGRSARTEASIKICEADHTSWLRRTLDRLASR